MKLVQLLFALVVTLVATQTARAGFEVWSADMEEDPFSGGSSVTLDYLDTLRSGAFLICNTDSKAITVRVVHGWEFQLSAAVEHSLKVAVDGELLLDITADGVAVGDNIAASNAELDREQTEKLIAAFSKARKSIDFKAEISTGFLHTSARGSTAAAEKLRQCTGS